MHAGFWLKALTKRKYLEDLCTMGR